MTAPLPAKIDDPLILYGESFASRLLLGTSRYPSPQVLETAVQRARPAMITASLRRQGSAASEASSTRGDHHRTNGTRGF
jgi:thiazole synthase